MNQKLLLVLLISLVLVQLVWTKSFSDIMGQADILRNAANKFHEVIGSGNDYSEERDGPARAEGGGWHRTGMFFACRTGYYLINPRKCRGYDLY